MKPATGAFDLPQGYRLRPVLAQVRDSASDPTLVLDERLGYWLAFHTPDGPATVRILPSAGRAVVGAWGPGRDWALAGAPALLGLTDDWADFDSAIVPRLPDHLRAARRLLPHLRATATCRVWDSLFPAVLGQKVTYMEAQYAYTYLTQRHASPAPGALDGTAPPWLRLPLTQAQVRGISSWEWHAARVDHHRSRTLLEAARAGVNQLGSLSESEAAARLQSLPGVGLWTAAETVQRSHAAKDAISVGDYHLAHIVGHAFLGRRTDDAGMLRLLAPYAGQRHRVIRVIGAAGVRKQAFGPRLAPEDHRER